MSDELELNPPSATRALVRSDPTTRLAWAGFRRWQAPIWLKLCSVLFVVVTWLPIAIAIENRTDMNKQTPRVHLVQDMDNQTKYRPQDENPLFNDHRADRARIPGTVARGELYADLAYNYGYSEAAGADGKIARTFIAGFPDQIQQKLNDPAQAQAFLTLGQEKFAINCMICHGAAGQGNGPIAARAEEVGAKVTGWTDPSNLTDEVRRGRPSGHLFNTVNNGIRKMGGYGDRMSAEQRWAVVAYVRTLQLAEHAPASVLTPEQKNALQ